MQNDSLPAIWLVGNEHRGDQHAIVSVFKLGEHEREEGLLTPVLCLPRSLYLLRPLAVTADDRYASEP